MRVEEALGLDNGSANSYLPLPARAERRIATEPVKVSFGLWYQLEDCEAGRLIAQANNALGRVRSTFERVRHSRALLLTMDECRGVLGEKQWSDFAPTLARKADQYDEQRWNAFWLSDAVQSSLGRTAPLETALQSNAPDHWRALADAIDPVEDEAIDADSWYAAESALHRSAAVGEAVRFMVYTTHALNRVSDAIATSREGRETCMRKDKRVVALMRGHYGNELQPLMALGDTTLRVTSEVLEDVVENMAPSEPVSEGMALWKEQWAGQRVFTEYRNATRQHAAAIGRILAACKMSL